MKRIIYIVLLSILSFSIISCKNNEESTTSTQYMEYYPDGYLDVVDSKYFLECENKGTLIKSSYPSYDYLNDVEKTNKKDRDFKIYLPYGYDENDLDTKYNILYLMHGWFGSINSFFNSYTLYLLLGSN